MEMNGFKIGSIRGIPIRIHFTFLLILPLLAFAFSRAFREAARVAEVPANELGSPLLWGLGLALALFLSVLLHELAHSLYALRKGGQVRDITLMMVGGVSQISEMPREPRHEAIMAFAGPLTSIVLGVVLFGVHALIADTPSFQLRFATFYLGGLNLFLGFFNLLPAFPMDGGRILRALLSGRLGIVKATRISAGLGKVFAVLFGIWGLATMNVLLMLIGVFVYMGAEGEKRAVMVKSLIGRMRVRDLMASRELADAPAISPDDDAATALRIMNETDASHLAVIDADGTRLGSLDREDIIRGLKQGEHGAAATSGERGQYPDGDTRPDEAQPASIPGYPAREGSSDPWRRRTPDGHLPR
jgi:Zn-dependent protease